MRTHLYRSNMPILAYSRRAYYTLGTAERCQKNGSVCSRQHDAVAYAVGGSVWASNRGSAWYGSICGRVCKKDRCKKRGGGSYKKKEKPMHSYGSVEKSLKSPSQIRCMLYSSVLFLRFFLCVCVCVFLFVCVCACVMHTYSCVLAYQDHWAWSSVETAVWNWKNKNKNK